jgi:3-oxoacyl-[acyl-carrier protein] reductase
VPRELSKAVAVITGASRGIGRAVTLDLADHGATLFLIARNGEALSAVADEARSRGARCHTHQVDLVQPDSIVGVRTALESAFGRIDLLVNNAGVAEAKPFLSTTREDLRRHFAINVEVPYFLTQELVPLLAGGAAGEGVVMNIASVVAHKGYAEQSAYGATKHALLGFTKAAAKELREKGIRLHAISPGGTATDMIKGVRPDLDPEILIQPQAIARTVRFLYELGDGAAVDEIQIRRAHGTPWA